MSYNFTKDWFSRFIPVWSEALKILPPVKRIIEIGSFEGRATTWLIDHTPVEELFCIDTWGDGQEHFEDVVMTDVEARFDSNVAVARSNNYGLTGFYKVKSRSLPALSALLEKGHESSFDLIYVDGSHTALDAMTDLLLAYYLCKVGGAIFVDDYVWRIEAESNPLAVPKIGIDAVTNVLHDKISILQAPLYQLYLQKVR